MDYTLTFTQEDLIVMDKALPLLPYKDVAPLINKINFQIQEQLTKDKQAESTE